MMIEATKSVRTPSSVRRTMKPVIPRKTLGRLCRRGSAVPVSLRNPAVSGSVLTAASADTGAMRLGSLWTRSTASVSGVLDKVNRSEPVSVLVQVERSSVGLQAGDALAMGIDEVLEPPEDVPAFVVLDLLHLADDLAALLLVHGRERLLVELVELRVVPMRLVEGRAWQAARTHLREVVARSPVIRGESPLEVLVAVEDAAVDVLDVDLDAGVLRVLGEDLRALDHAGVGRRRVQVDSQAVLPGRAQERLRLVGILLSLRKIAAGVTGVERRVDVVRNRAMTREGLRDHLLPVGDETERLADARVLERLLIDPHADRIPGAGLRLVDGEVLAPLDQGNLSVRYVTDGVELTTEEGVDLGRLRGEVNDLDLIEVRLAFAPVVLVADMDAPLAGLEALDLVRPGPDRIALADAVRAVALGHDRVVVLGEGVEQRRVGTGEVQRDRSFVDLVDRIAVDRGEASVPEEPQI